jgi:hypothetical protein
LPKFVFNPLGPPFDLVSSGGGGSGVDILTGNDGNSVNPDVDGNINIVGTGVSSSGLSSAPNIYVSGTGSTLTINETKAQFLTNYTQPGSYPYSALATDYYISVDSSVSAHSIILPTAPTTGRIFIVKDRTGDASSNNITVSSGGTDIDGASTYVLDGAYESSSFIYNGSTYETY